MTEAMATLCFILQKSPAEIRSEISTIETNKFKNLRDWLASYIKGFKSYDRNYTITADDILKMITDQYDDFDDDEYINNSSKTTTSYVVDYFRDMYHIYKCETTVYDSGEVFINGERFFGHVFETFELAKNFVQKQLQSDFNHRQNMVLENQKILEELKVVEKSIDSLNESDLQSPPPKQFKFNCL